MTNTGVTVSEEIRRRICAEYTEMPGLLLTLAQARRMWCLDEETCNQVLESLTDEKFLYRRADGTYGRWSDAAGFPPPRMVKAAGVSADRSARAPSRFDEGEVQDRRRVNTGHDARRTT
jgi:hypothetical protein